MGSLIDGSLEPLGTILPLYVPRAFSKPFIAPSPCCREVLVSRTTIVVVFPVWATDEDMNFCFMSSQFERDMTELKISRFIPKVTRTLQIVSKQFFSNINSIIIRSICQKPESVFLVQVFAGTKVGSLASSIGWIIKSMNNKIGWIIKASSKKNSIFFVRKYVYSSVETFS